MKKNFIKTGKIVLSCICTFLILCSFMVISAGAASDIAPDKLSKYGQKTFKIYKVEGNAPKQDGVVNANEYGDVVSTMNPGDDWSYLSLVSGVPDSVATKNSKLYMTYDNTNIYIGVVAEDPGFLAYYEGLHIWKGDYLEVDIAQVPDTFRKQGDKLRFAMALGKNNITNAYFDNISTYAAEQIGGIHTTITNDPMDVIGKRVKINVKHSGNKTTYELAMPISVCFKAGLPQRALFYYQHGIANEGYQHSNPDNGTYLGVIRLGKQMTGQQKNEISAATGEPVGDIPSQMYTVLEFTRKTGGGGTTSSAPSQNSQTSSTGSKPTTSVSGGGSTVGGTSSAPTTSTGSVADTTTSDNQTVSDAQNSDTQSTTSEITGGDDEVIDVENQQGSTAKKKNYTPFIILGIFFFVCAVGLWIFAIIYLKRKK